MTGANMHMPTKAILLVLAALAFAPGSAVAGDNSFWGTGIGAALGGWAGSHIGRGSGRLAATGAGVFLGGAIGNSIGQSMDRTEAMSARGYGYAPVQPYAPYYAYEPNYVAPPAPVMPPQRRVVYLEQEVVEYRDPAPTYATGGYLGADEDSVPVSNRSSRYCREFTQNITVGGRVQESYGTACLQPDGSWQIEP